MQLKSQSQHITASTALSIAEQTQALAADPQRSVFLSASAGTGKTKVLIDRYLRLLLSGTTPRQILCITFTNAAAAEMRSRIIAKLEKWAVCPTTELEADLMKLEGVCSPSLLNTSRGLHKLFSEEVDQVKIQTVHSFCLNILKSSPHSPYHLREIIEPSSRRRLFRAAVDEVLKNTEDQYLQSAITKLMAFYDKKRISELIDSVISSKICFLQYLGQFESEHSLKQAIYSKHGANIEKSSEAIAKAALDDIDFAQLQLAEAVLCAAAEPIGPRLRAALNDFMLYKQLLLNSNGEPSSRIVKAKFSKEYPQIHDFLLKEQSRIHECAMEYNRNISAELCFALTLCAKRVLAVFEMLKADEYLLEYDDLIIETISLLENSENAHLTLYRLDLALDHILVDEAQDLSEPQWRLIKLISDEFFAGIGAKTCNRTIFIVGDYKQSIYSFQSANPEEFRKAKEHFGSKAKNALKSWSALSMNVSFRSTKPILDFVDLTLSKVVCSDYEAHIPHREGNGNVEVWPLIPNLKQSSLSGWDIPERGGKPAQTPKRILAKALAVKVADWISSKRMLYGTHRAVQPGDIMILLRKRSELVSYIIYELKTLGIPVLECAQPNICEHLLGLDIISLIRFINTQGDDYNLACLLKSPIIGITEEKLFEICHKRPGSVWDNLQLLAPEQYEYLKEILNLSHSLRPFQLLDKVLHFDSKREALLTSHGNNAKNILDTILEAVIKFDSTSKNPYSYYELTQWLTEYDIKTEALSSQDKVRIMTVHASKGLQAPIIFLADSASSEQTPNENMFWDDDGMLLFSAYKEFDSEVIKRAKEHNRAMQSAESNRLLYVALTRAENELYICGWENNRVRGSWYDIIAQKHTPLNQSPSFATSMPPPPADTTKVAALPKLELNKHIVVRPSKGENFSTPVAIIERGCAVHKLLHVLPKYERDLWNNLLMQYDDTVKNDILLTIDSFPHLFFGSNILSELSLVGNVDGVELHARVDKVLISKDSITIVDFKTGSVIQPEHIPDNYKTQLQLYRALFQKKYASRKIRTYLLFTSHQIMLEVEEAC